MKTINEINSGCHANWLGFSLSPHMIMEVPTDPQQQEANALSTSFFLSSFHELSNSGICYGVSGGNGGFDSALSVMPLKSDGSLCLMEAFSRPELGGMVPSSSPKLEDFLGGATVTIGSHQYVYNSGLLPCHELYQPPLETGTKNNNTQLLGQSPPYGGGLNWKMNKMIDHDDGMGYGDLQSLSLSMSPGYVTIPNQVSPSGTDSIATESKKRGFSKMGQKQIVHRKSIETFGQRTSQYRGVTRHRWTGRYEAHLWDNSVKKEGQTRKGRQVYLGGYDMEEKAARAYDLAALKYWGPSTRLNSPLENYGLELEDMKNMTRQEYVAHLRRKSSGFSRGASIYRGVTRHHQHGRWQARIGRVAGNKDLYLGTFSTQEEAAEAYDIAAIKFRGVSAVTNFEITRYDIEKILASNTLLSGEEARRYKETEANPNIFSHSHSSSSTQNNAEAITTKNDFSMALQNLMVTDTVNSTQKIVDVSADNNDIGTYFSNNSSSVTSLGSSSREASPDKSGLSMVFDKDFLASKSGISSWFSSAQLSSAPAISSVQLPVFAAWNDT